MSRDPYTYAADYLREAHSDAGFGGGMLSRAEASFIRRMVADALGLDDEYVARELAAQYKRVHGLVDPREDAS